MSNQTIKENFIMKKSSLLFAAATGAMILALSGCAKNENYAQKSYCSDGIEIQSVVIDVSDRQLEISASEDNNVYIEYFDGEKEYLDVTVSKESVLTVKCVYDKKWTDFVGVKKFEAKYRSIKIRVPDGITGAFTAHTTNGDISASAVSFGDKVNLGADGGSVVLERLSAGKAINLKAKNGDIRGTVTGGWDDYSISCTIKKGDCNLPLNKVGGDKAFSADCNNGDIKIDFVK